MAKMINIDFSHLALDFEGEVLFSDRKPEIQTLAWCLNKFILQQQVTGPTLKLVIWAGDLRENKRLVIDEEDYKILYDIVDKAAVVAAVKAPIMTAMAAAKDALDKTKTVIAKDY